MKKFQLAKTILIKSLSGAVVLTILQLAPVPVLAQSSSPKQPPKPTKPLPNQKPAAAPPSNLTAPAGTATPPLNLPGSNVQRINVGQSPELGRYTLGAGDIVKIDVFNVPEISGNQTVAPDGTVNIALIGAVTVQGLSIEEASRLLENRLSPFLVRKIVNVSLVEPRPLNIAVVGEVNRPGTRVITYSRSTATGRDAQAATLTRAIEVAGGVTQQADVGNIQISRLDVGGRRRLIKVNLLALLEQGDLSQDAKILDGDSILVPRLTESSAFQPRQVSNASFAADTFTIQVAIAGEVNRTGPQVLTYSRLVNQAASNSREQIDQQPSITRAIQSAGGITERADIRNIQIVRLGVGGERQVINVNLWELISKGDLSQNVRLADGDSITIPQATAPNVAEFAQVAKATFSPDRIGIQVIGEVVRPGAVELRPNTPFTQAITAAGGITNDGDWRTVELYRLNPDGTLTRRNLVADLNLPPNEESNPGLRDRDVIVVRPSFGASLLSSTSRFLNTLSPILLINNLFR